MKIRENFLTQKHHRRCRSLGGKCTPSNISYVYENQHISYHIIFGNKNIFQIEEWLNEVCPFKPENFSVKAKFINGKRIEKSGDLKSVCKSKQKLKQAWVVLMDGLETFPEQIQYLNNVWLDPSYHLYVKEKKIRRKK